CSFFFFSSRRRHTRFSRDWSSDVCSSDLVGFLTLPIMAAINNFGHDFGQISAQLPELKILLQDKYFLFKIFVFENFGYKISVDQIGRASCRERVEISVV